MTNTPNTTKANVFYPVANGGSSSNPFVFEFQARDPNGNDLNYPIQKFWLNTSNNNIWFLKNFTSSAGVVQAHWIFLGNGASALETLTGDDGVAVNPVSNNINTLGNAVANATHAKPVFFRSGGDPNLDLDVQVSVASASSNINNAGLSSFNSVSFTVDANGYVSGTGFAINYTNVTHAMSPYTVLSTDYYISVDCSAGTVQLQFPNSPTFKRTWIIKDRTGNAATNNITLTTPGGVVTFDGLTTYTMNSNYQAINLLANNTPTYEVY